jgi:hypothetical protein
MSNPTYEIVIRDFLAYLSKKKIDFCMYDLEEFSPVVGKELVKLIQGFLEEIEKREE